MDADFYIRLLLAALVIVAIWNALDRGEVLGFIGKRLEGKWWGKPLGMCPPCAASVHGTWLWLLTGGEWTGIPIFVLALSGLMVIVTRRLLAD